MKVIVIGGGFAGLTTCTSLRKVDRKVEIILIEPKDYMEVHWASIRGLFDGDLGSEALLELTHVVVPKSITHIRATVTQLTETQATLSNGEVLEFHVAVICTGSHTRYAALGKGLPGRARGSGDRSRRIAQMTAEGESLVNAQSVLIVGGGMIGVELAGDLAYYTRERFPNKKLKITLVHSGDTLIPEFSPRAGTMVKQKLESMGVQVLLNEKVIQQPPANASSGGNPKVIYQKANREVLADHVIWTTGIYPCNSFLGRQYLNRKGWIQVDDYFRVIKASTTNPNQGQEQKDGEEVTETKQKAQPRKHTPCNSLFAVGDCCNLLPNTGAQAMGTAKIIGKNIKVVLDAMEQDDMSMVERKMKKALAQPEIYVTTIGKQTGVAMLPCTHTQFLLPWMKNATMFLDKPKKEFGLSK